MRIFEWLASKLPGRKGVGSEIVRWKFLLFPMDAPTDWHQYGSFREGRSWSEERRWLCFAKVRYVLLQRMLRDSEGHWYPSGKLYWNLLGWEDRVGPDGHSEHREDRLRKEKEMFDSQIEFSRTMAEGQLNLLKLEAEQSRRRGPFKLDFDQDDEDLWSVSCPALGCTAYGETKREGFRKFMAQVSTEFSQNNRPLCLCDHPSCDLCKPYIAMAEAGERSFPDGYIEEALEEAKRIEDDRGAESALTFLRVVLGIRRRELPPEVIEWGKNVVARLEKEKGAPDGQ